MSGKVAGVGETITLAQLTLTGYDATGKYQEVGPGFVAEWQRQGTRGRGRAFKENGGDGGLGHDL